MEVAIKRFRAQSVSGVLRATCHHPRMDPACYEIVPSISWDLTGAGVGSASEVRGWSVSVITASEECARICCRSRGGVPPPAR